MTVSGTNDGDDVVYVHELRRLVDELGAAVERAERRGYQGLADNLLDAQKAAERAIVMLQEGQLP